MAAPVHVILRLCAIAAAVALLTAQPAQAQSANTSFFVTSAGIGNAGNLGGLAGADNHCQTLAQAAGAGAKTWHAYLSTQAADGQPAVNARDRIGKGPWQNTKGVVIAKDVAELHGSNNVNKETALTEKGEQVNGYGDKPNRHDIPNGIEPGRHALNRGRRPPLKELDKQNARRGDVRPHRPQRSRTAPN